MNSGGATADESTCSALSAAAPTAWSLHIFHAAPAEVDVRSGVENRKPGEPGFPTGRKRRVHFVKFFPTGRKWADFPIDNSLAYVLG